MQTLLDFIRFDLFISPYIIIIFYYMGALVMPFASWFFALWVKNRYTVIANTYKASQETFKQHIKRQYRFLIYLLFFLFFIMMEIMWRVLFEFIIAYLQMRDALMLMSV